MSLKSFIKEKLLEHGAVLSRPPGQFNVFQWKLEQLKARGAEIRCVIDGGACNGGWSAEFAEVFPEIVSVLIEPRADAQADLQAVARRCPKFIIVQALIGAVEQTIQFNSADAQSSILPDAEGKAFGKLEEARMTTIDRLAQVHGIAPDYIKLDLQGAELEALRGATETLKTCSFVQLELSLLPFQQGQPVFSEVVNFMHERGYALYDIPALWHRPLDGSLAQGDFLFIRAEHPLRRDARWSNSTAQ